MEQETKPTVLMASKDEIELLMRLLLFVQSTGYGEVTLTVHTDNEGNKKVLLMEGTKINFYLK